MAAAARRIGEKCVFVDLRYVSAGGVIRFA
jgi:hypothetical protein